MCGVLFSNYTCIGLNSILLDQPNIRIILYDLFLGIEGHSQYLQNKKAPAINPWSGKFLKIY